MPKYTILAPKISGMRKILKDGKFYFILGVYNTTPDFKVQEVAQHVIEALNKLDVLE